MSKPKYEYVVVDWGTWGIDVQLSTKIVVKDHLNVKNGDACSLQGTDPVKYIFNGFILFVCISVHPLSNGRDISSYFCKFTPICKAPLYARMFGNLLYEHKKTLTLLIKNIFSMVLYSLCVFLCIHFQMDGIFPRTSVNSPLYVRHP